MNENRNITFRMSYEELGIVAEALMKLATLRTREIEQTADLRSQVESLKSLMGWRDTKIEQLKKSLKKATDELKALKANQPADLTETR